VHCSGCNGGLLTNAAAAAMDTMGCVTKACSAIAYIISSSCPNTQQGWSQLALHSLCMPRTSHSIQWCINASLSIPVDPDASHSMLSVHPRALPHLSLWACPVHPMQTGWLAAGVWVVWVGVMAGVAWVGVQRHPLARPARPSSQTAAAGGPWAGMKHAWPGPAGQVTPRS
jgi:hypothetical protein